LKLVHYLLDLIQNVKKKIYSVNLYFTIISNSTNHRLSNPFNFNTPLSRL